MRWIATLIVGGALGFACASGQAEDVTDDTGATEPGDSGPSDDKPITSPSNDDDKDKDAGSTKKPDAKADAKASQDPEPDPDPDPVTPGQKTVNCDATFTVGYTSNSVIKYTLSATGDVTIDSMKTTVTNLYALDLNDLTVSLKPKGGSTYDTVFSSGDVLADGQQVSLAFPSSFTASKGDTLRIDTFFDVLFVVDPSATCYVTF